MCLTEIKPTKVILSQFQREQHLRNPLIFERARFRRFSALRPDTERTNRPTRAVISRQRPSKIKNLTELIPYRGYASALGSTPGCKTPVTKNEGMAEVARTYFRKPRFGPNLRTFIIYLLIELRLSHLSHQKAAEHSSSLF